LEYYSGILFLTTNRVGTIDDAFRSRLHLTLYYPKLDRKQTVKIWQMNLRRMKAMNAERIAAGRAPVDFDEKKILKWAKKHWENVQWNGRQIRNAFQTAVALGEFKAKAFVPADGSPSTKQVQNAVMDVSHLNTIAKASALFNDYLRQVHGVEEDKAAFKDRFRADPETQIKAFVYSSDEDSDSDSEKSSNGDSDDSDEDSDESSDMEEKKKKKAKSKKRKEKAKDKKKK
jgi:hypothetical protein